MAGSKRRLIATLLSVLASRSITLRVLLFENDTDPQGRRVHALIDWVSRME